MLETLYIDLKVVSCQCACKHCSESGKPGNYLMPLEMVEDIIIQGQECSKEFGIFPLDDLTAYPNFEKFIELLIKYDINNEVLPTNGTNPELKSKLHTLKKDYGKKQLQFAFHGLKDRHNDFVGIEGAFESLIDLIRKGIELDYKFWIMVFTNKENIQEIKELDIILQEMGIAPNDIGFVDYQYFGRAMKLDHLRFTREEHNNIEKRYRPMPPRRFTESEWLDMIEKDDGNFAEFNFALPKEEMKLRIDENLDVYLYPFTPETLILKGAKEGFKLGNLKEYRLKEILEQAKKERPPYLQTLESTNIKEMAKRIGEKGEILYPHNDVPTYKWPYEYLKSEIGK